jgi:hypothetical protein
LIKRVALIVVTFPKVFVFDPSRIKLLKVVELEPPMLWAEPAREMVLLVLIKLAPLLIQSPYTVWVYAPAVKPVPEPRVRSPFISRAPAAVLKSLTDVSRF